MRDYASAAFTTGSEGTILQPGTVWTNRIWTPLQVKNSLDCWKVKHRVCVGFPFISPVPTITVSTDTSLVGWGSTPQHTHNSGQMVTSGKRSPYPLVKTSGSHKLRVNQSDSWWTMWLARSVATNREEQDPPPCVLKL